MHSFVNSMWKSGLLMHDKKLKNRDMWKNCVICAICSSSGCHIVIAKYHKQNFACRRESNLSAIDSQCLAHCLTKFPQPVSLLCCWTRKWAWDGGILVASQPFQFSKRPTCWKNVAQKWPERFYWQRWNWLSFSFIGFFPARLRDSEIGLISSPAVNNKQATLPLALMISREVVAPQWTTWD